MAFLQRVLTDLGFQFLPEGKDSDVAEVDAAYTRDQGAFYVVDSEGEICGCVGVRRLSREAAELKRLYLAPQLRRQGVGRRLCLVAIGEARRLGYEHLRLDTTTRSPAAMALFRDLGFYAIPRYNSDPHAEVFMEYALSTEANTPGTELKRES